MVVGLILRAGVVYAVVMVTKNYGVWGSPNKTQDVYDETVERIEPYADRARRQLNICPPRPPPQGEWSFFGIHYYNQLVKSVFDLLSVIPAGLASFLGKVPSFVNAFNETIQKYIKESQSTKKEIKISKGQLDETPLVRPPGLVPPHCKDKDCPKAPLIPPGCDRNRDSFIYEPRLPKKPPCECSKCKQRQAENWKDNKRKCARLPSDEGKCRCGEKPQSEPRSEPIKSCKQCRKTPRETAT
ncbi:uncharacterized protein LOC6548164 [Drosophila erecta]|uniref:MICOS complex subunit MIC13 n=1 Tax=Drosophila erecta TaxID=7220 RepID=B3NP31_DROER|nr:uncharacterized protein LOC6548164 [Drosophila erecta]EDV55670.2 uncharacterized protein Dere_GG22223 [Drosophila erecta]